MPYRQEDLRAWGDRFSLTLELDPGGYGTTAEQASIVRLAYDDFAVALARATNKTTNSEVNTRLKNDARKAMVEKARELVRIIQAWPGITDAKRDALGITVPDPEPTPLPAPSAPPTVEVVAVLGHTVKVRLKGGSGRGKPMGVIGATLMTYVGPEVPTDLEAWCFKQMVSKTTEDIKFPPTVPAGSKVWITAFWFSRVSKTSRAAVPVSVYLADGVTKAA